MISFAFFELEMEQIQENQDDTDKASAQWRIQESQIFNITRCFRDVMNRYNQESVLHRERCKKVIVRELEICEYRSRLKFNIHFLLIAGNKRSDDEVEEMLQNGFPGTFSSSVRF